MNTVIEVKDLTKKFGALEALKRVDLSIEEGSVFGFLGPNGAGKTTTIRILSGLLKPTSGTVKVLGRDVLSDDNYIRSKCGVQTDTNLYERLSAYDNLDIWGKLYGLDGPDLEKRINDLLDMFNLEDRRRELVGNLSKGMRQKVAVARAIIHEPDILFLDEPTAGLDPEASEDLLHYLKKYVKDGKRTVFLCSHRLDEVEGFCDTVSIIDKGAILASGTVEELSKRSYGENNYSIGIRNLDASHVDAISKTNLTTRLEQSGGRIRMSLKNRDDISEIVKSLACSGAKITSVNEERHSLKDIYFSIVPKENHNGR